MNNKKPNYDLKSDFFRKNPLYKRLAKEHISLAEIDSDLFDWEIIETRTKFKIPCEYLMHFKLKTIIGIEEDQSPIYGDRHTVNITFPPKYPIESPLLYMKSEVWHPNIKSEGRYAGRICGNTKGFGVNFDLTMLVMRIGEILHYKNYHATHTPPFPEDAKVADWVTSYAEPNNIVNKTKGLNSAFFKASSSPKTVVQRQPTPSPTPPVNTEVAEAPKKFKLTITGKRKVPKPKIKIERKE